MDKGRRLKLVKKVIVSWSGGIDSTYVLYHLLKDKDYEVHAHHVKLLNRGSMMEKQLQAIKILEPMLQKVRPFKYTESTQYLSMMGDSWISLVDVIRIAYKEEYDTMYVAVNKTENEIEGERYNQSYEQCISIEMLAASAYINNTYTNHKATLSYFPTRGMTKEEIWNGLSKELQDNVWWCREPQGDEVCYECPQCLDVKEIKQ